MKVPALLLLAAAAVRAAPPQEVVLRPDLPAGEEWYTPESTNQHVNSPAEKWVRKVQRPTMEVYPAADPNGSAIVVAPGGESAVRRPVRLGRRNSDYIEVLDGLDPGEKVITSSYSGLVDKTRLDFQRD